MRRRRTLVLLLLLIVAPTAGVPAQAIAFPDGAAAGDVTHEAAVIWTRASGPADVVVEYATNPDLVGAQRSVVARADRETGFTAKVDLRGLAPQRRYHYRVVAGSGRGVVGTFVTPPAPDRTAPVTLIWGADTSEAHQPFAIFEVMRRRNPDLFLYLGDTIYADHGPLRARTVEQYREKYRINRQDSHLRSFLAGTSTWAIWDDHEVENDFDSTHPRLLTGLRAFLDSWPIRTPPGQPNQLYRSFQWGRTAEFFILDTRQYRSPASQPDGPGKTMLGRAQKQWLLDGLTGSDAAVKFVVSSVVLRHHGSDSWGGYATERDEILRFIQDRRIRNVVFLAGDVHYAALIRHPEGVYEAISGPLAAIPNPRAAAARRPGTLWAATLRYNYGWMQVSGEGITAEWRDEQDRLLHRAQIPVNP
ncbi:MAG: alkaline phosphatase D family protein [Armatimonadetes bacterium]|nr:alkaline phosphatase D family protein [Armatimonadota bacterium]